MRWWLATCFAFVATAAASTADPIAMCRQMHEQNPPAHIACLEEALRSQAVAAPAKAEAGSAGLGAEQVRRNSQRAANAAPDAMAVQIVSVTYDAEGRGVFIMADGQRWRETERALKSNKLNTESQYTARIERGKLGGYRMYVDGVRRMIKVERVE